MTIYDKFLILNPAYYLRNDVHRSLIGSFEFPKIEAEQYEPHILHNIHPIIAQFLSFFSYNNKKSFAQIEKEIENYFHLSAEQVEEIIRPMINNDSPLIKVFNGTDIVLPKNLLIETEIERTESYNPQDFIIEDELDLKTVRLYKPIHAILELTMRCFADCVYCYADRKGHENEYLPTNIALQFIIEAKNLGFANIEVNGGEILLHPNIDEILLELASCGYNSLISTKIPLSEDKIKFLKSIGMTRIQISLDSLNPLTEKSLINVNESYLEKLMKTMKLLDKYEFLWQINTVLTNKNCNIENVGSIISKVSTFNNLQGIKFSPMGYPMYKNLTVFEDLHPSVEQLLSIREYLDSVRSKNPNYWITIGDEETISNFNCKNWAKFDQRSLCTANQKAFNVLPDGKVTICEELYWHPAFIIGDITKSSILDIWNSEKAKKLFFCQNEYFSDKSSCYSCEKLVECRHNKGVCWKQVIMAYGHEHWDYPDPRCPKAPLPYNKFYI